MWDGQTDCVCVCVCVCVEGREGEDKEKEGGKEGSGGKGRKRSRGEAVRVDKGGETREFLQRKTQFSDFKSFPEQNI